MKTRVLSHQTTRRLKAKQSDPSYAPILRRQEKFQGGKNRKSRYKVYYGSTMWEAQENENINSDAGQEIQTHRERIYALSQ